MRTATVDRTGEILCGKCVVSKLGDYSVYDKVLN